MTMTLAIPTPPTSRATAPSPRNSLLYAPLVTTSAWMMPDSSVTSTVEGSAGLTVAGSTAATASTWLESLRTNSSVGLPSKPKYCSATGKPMNAMLSIVVCSSMWLRTPTTVNQCPPIHTWVG